MNFANEINENFLDSVYNNLQKEQSKLMQELQGLSDENTKKKSALLTKQITHINNINMNIIKLRNLRKKNED